MKTNLIKKPRITEKASVLYESNVYTFNVGDRATKSEVAKSIFDIYKVRPEKVNIVTIKPKKVFSRRTGARGTKSGGKKAYVYLKKGDKIEIV